MFMEEIYNMKINALIIIPKKNCHNMHVIKFKMKSLCDNMKFTPVIM